jgi:uroporphyrinogen decarboxylase
MKHRKRVMKSLNHEEPDRCPMQVSFTPEFAERLRNSLELAGIDDRKEHNPHGGGNTYQLELALDNDMLLTSVGWANSYYQEQEEYTDEWGIGWHSIEYETPFGTGRYTEICHNPLSADAAIEHYLPPDPQRPDLYTEAQNLIDSFSDEYWIVGVTVTTIFECAWALRGLEMLLMDFVLNPELAERILDIPYHYHLSAAKNLVNMGVDMLWIGDDVGAQHGMLISPEVWRKFLKPRLANFVETLRDLKPDIKIAYHSDGDILPIIPELIEVGVDVLNPIQPASMDPVEVKRKFGDRLCFWGSIDEQHTLPFGKPEEVKEEVLSRLKTVGRGGGLIIGPTHHVQLDTPMENFWTMVNTVKNTPYSAFD